MACGDGPSNPVPQGPFTMSIEPAPPCTTVGQPLPSPLIAELTDADGRPASGVLLTFTVTAGDGMVSPASVRTGSDGKGSTTYTCGTRALQFGGVEKVTVAADNLTGPPGVWSIQAGRSAAFSAIRFGAPDSSLAIIGAGPIDLTAVPVDAYGNAIFSGLTINWAIESGGGSLASASTPVGLGGADNRWFIGASTGIQTVLLTVPEVPAFAQKLHVRVLSGSPQVIASAPQQYTVTVGSDLPSPLGVQVVAPGGEPLPRVLVTFLESPLLDSLAMVQGDAYLASRGTAAGQTDGSGHAAASVRFRTVVPSEGPTVTFRADPFLWTGGSTCACTPTWTVTIEPHPAARLVRESGDNQAGVAGQPLGLPVVVHLTDEFDNSVTGTLTWTPSGGGSVAQPSTTTSSDGRSSNTWTLGPAVGTQTLTVTSGAATTTFTAQAAAP